jgi:hypothetical protein
MKSAQEQKESDHTTEPPCALSCSTLLSKRSFTEPQLRVAVDLHARRDDYLTGWRQPSKVSLLHFVQLLVDHHRNQHQKKHSRANAENAHRQGELVDLGQ